MVKRSISGKAATKMLKQKDTADLPIIADQESGGSFATGARIFINYRRQDSKHAALYLRSLLAKRFGTNSIFRDLDSIKPGADFPAIIQSSIAGAAAFIVLIGKNWLTVKSKNKQIRLFEKHDYVRTEIESAMNLGIEIIPVMLNGATMPEAKNLPKSIEKLATMNGIELSWLEGVTKIGQQVYEIEKRKAREKADAAKRAKNIELPTGAFLNQKKRAGKNIFIAAMEFSLKLQGKRVSLDEKDFLRTLDKMQDKELKGTNSFFMEDVIYILDVVGIKEKKSDKRYIARSYLLKSIDDLPLQLTLKRLVLCSILFDFSWYDDKTIVPELIDIDTNKEPMNASTTAFIRGWNYEKEHIKLQTAYTNWGNNGLLTMTKAAALHHIEKQYLRSIEAVEMPRSYKQTMDSWLGKKVK